MNDTTISKRIGHYSESEIDDETVLMQIDSGEFFSLRDTGRTIWRLIDDAPDRTALLAALAQRYDAPADDLAADLDEFLVALGDAGFIDLR